MDSVVFQARVRSFVRCAIVAMFGFATLVASGDELPPTIKVLVGYPPGGGTDLVARVYAAELAKELKRPVIVENRPGAGGQIAARLLKDAPADGGTLMVAIDHQIVMIPRIVKAPGYDAQGDFQPIIQLATYTMCAGVSWHTPARNFAEWEALARKSSEFRSVAVPAVGSNAYFLARALGRHMGVDFDVVPYQGGAPLITDLSGGHVSAFVLPCGEAILAANAAGRARILLTSADQQANGLPGASTFGAERLQVPSSEGYFIAVYASAKLSPSIAETLRRASEAAAGVPGMSSRIHSTGMVPLTASAQSLEEKVERSSAAWTTLIQQSGFSPE